MKLVSVYNSFLIILLLINNCTKAQSINGDTIYVDSKTVVAVRFPSLPSTFYTNPADAPYNLITLPTGFTIIAKKKNTAPATLTVTEGKRTHNFVIFYKKDLDHTNLSETDYDFSTVKKLKQHVKEREEREKKYNEMVESADKLFEQQDYENAKVSYSQALLILSRPWPADQLKKITKLSKKVKKKRN